MLTQYYFALLYPQLKRAESKRFLPVLFPKQSGQTLFNSLSRSNPGDLVF